jgi:hypothetical protein
MILLLEGLAGISVLTFRPIAYTRNSRNSSGYYHRGGVRKDQYWTDPRHVLWRKPSGYVRVIFTSASQCKVPGEGLLPYGA